MRRAHDGHLESELVAPHERLDEMAARQARIEDVLVRLAACRRFELPTSADVRRLLNIGRTQLHALVVSGELPI